MRLALEGESKFAAESFWGRWELPVRTCRLPLGIGPVPPGTQGQGVDLSAVWVRASGNPEGAAVPGSANRANWSQTGLSGDRGGSLPVPALRGDL